MKTKEEIKKQIEWLQSKYRGVERGSIPAINKEAAFDYYRGAINNLKWVLGE